MIGYKYTHFSCCDVYVALGPIHSGESGCHGEHSFYHCRARGHLQATGRDGQGARRDGHEVGEKRLVVRVHVLFTF